MSKSELFTKITTRNALRREAGLPLLNVREQIAKEEKVQEWRDFLTICEQNQSVLDRIKLRIKEDLAASGFNCQSFGGKIMLDLKAKAEFHDFLRGIGVKIPKVSGTHYGK